MGKGVAMQNLKIEHILLILTLFTSTLFSDAVIISDEKPTFERKHTFNKTIKKEITTKQKFKRDDHRYDKRYHNFNYDQNGYYNDEGLYYGYYDQTGYFFNNIFFQYNAQYSYQDRVYQRGYFQPHHRHLRVYRYHNNNDWNRIHCYREPNVVVREYYDNSPTYYHDSYQTHYYERDHGRVSHGRFSNHDNPRGYHQAPNRRNSFRQENRYNHPRRTHRRENHRRESYRNHEHRRDHGTITRGRFSDKSSSKHHRRSRSNNSSHKDGGHLSISK